LYIQSFINLDYWSLLEETLQNTEIEQVSIKGKRLHEGSLLSIETILESIKVSQSVIED
jgi:hypothetical protein